MANIDFWLFIPDICIWIGGIVQEEFVKDPRCLLSN